MLGYFRSTLMCGAAASAVLCWSAVDSSATVSVEEGTITGVFTAPVYSGFVANDPGYGSATYLDNSTTAPATTSISSDGSTLTWGNSSVQFTGATVPLADTTTPVKLGTITYTDGESDLDSLIFGATLSFSLDSMLLGFDKVINTTTKNLSNGDDLTSAQANRDADYLNICGNSSNICYYDIKSYDNTEGVDGARFSTPFVAALYGIYSIDPGLTVTGVSPGGGDGGIGMGLAGGVPEPSTWALMLLGFVGLGFAGHKRARKLSKA
jgi:hypothetical protein